MTSTPQTLRDAICQSLLSKAKFNRASQVAPAAVLWPDHAAVWSNVVPQLQRSLPSLLVYGQYAPEKRTGPAIWIKCAIAGVLPEVDLKGQVPIIYLPGVSRADLRDIERCPQDLQPLAELQFRGVFWTQENGKDWTINAFLTSKNGGLGLNVAQDKATQDALERALSSGVLLERPLAELASRLINAEWLDSLLAPNPSRDILVWLNDPERAHTEWVGAKWDVFVSRCRKDSGFDPEADGVLVAAERLAAHQGAWAAVWELYQDAYTSFPNVLGHLERVQLPTVRRFFDDLSGYPQANGDAENTLRNDLNAIQGMAPAEAREAVLRAEEAHRHRREWLWARMGRAPLAKALQHLARVAVLTQQELVGETVEQLAEKYTGGAWQVDAEAMLALAAVQSNADTAAVAGVLRAIYNPWLERAALSFQEAVKARGGLHFSRPAPVPITEGVCTVFVDGLRYDVAQQLVSLLGDVGEVTLDFNWTCIPPVTASGKAWVSPIAHLIDAKTADDQFVPAVAGSGKSLDTYQFRKLLAESGFQVLSNSETGDPSGKAWTECGNLDHYGHQHGLRLARDLSVQLDQIVERLLELRDVGWRRIQVVTDHGWLLVPGGMPKAVLLTHEAQSRSGRCALLTEQAQEAQLSFGWDWCKSVQVALAPGISAFRAGLEYAHGGLSLQECLVPVIDIRFTQTESPSIKVEITKVTWRGLRCVVEVSPVVAGLRADIRTKAALAESSVVANVRYLDNGKASLVVPDDEMMGAAAVVVIIDDQGTVLQKQATTIGG